MLAEDQHLVVAQELPGLVEMLGRGAGRHQHRAGRGVAQPGRHLAAAADQRPVACPGPVALVAGGAGTDDDRVAEPAQGVEDPLVGGVVDAAALAVRPVAAPSTVLTMLTRSHGRDGTAYAASRSRVRQLAQLSDVHRITQYCTPYGASS